MKSILNNRIVQHIAFWCFYFLIYTFNYAREGKYVTELLMTLSMMPIHMIFTYSQLYWLFPKFLLKRKFVAYAIFSILVTKFVSNLNMVIYTQYAYQFRSDRPSHIFGWQDFFKFHMFEFRSMYALFMIAGLAISIKMLKKWYKEKELNQKIEKEKLSIELEMLKAQVHPHFLFNTLNNLYSLTLTKSDSAPFVVSHLSELLRYMLYECNEKKVPLEKEIEILKKYVELEKLRYGNRIEVSFSTDGNIKENRIAPLLLLPFVENSFKHGTSEQLDQCWVNLHLYADGNNFTFTLSNSVNSEKVNPDAGGLGLQNIKKRLELIYPGKYTLTANEEEDMFIVKLQLQLNRAEQPKQSAVPEQTFLNPIPAVV